jgi:hypothetical protein
MTDLGSKLHNIDQGVFNTTKSINNIPNINLAFISNVNNTKADLFKEASINLNTIYLNYSDFNQLFFRGYAGAFHINPNNHNASVLSLTQQSYSTTHDSNNPFYLKEFLIKTYEKTHSINSMNIPIQTRIVLDREMFLAKSLYSINGYQTALSLDECINTLMMNGDIIKSDFDSSAKVIFIISLKYVQSDLQVSGIVNFRFITDIPGFSNNDAIMTLDLPKSYSNDIKKNTNKPDLGVKKEFYFASTSAPNNNNNSNNNDTSSEISDYKHDEYNDLDDKSFSINSINSGISGTIVNSHASSNGRSYDKSYVSNNDKSYVSNNDKSYVSNNDKSYVSNNDKSYVSNVSSHASNYINNDNYDENTIVSSSETLNTNVVKEVTNIIKSGESVVNSVAW